MLGGLRSARCSLVATDLDGTVLTSDGDIAASTCETMRDVTSHGVRMVVVTARPFEATRHLAEYLRASAAICLSGAVTYDVASAQVIESSPFRAPQVRLLAAEIRRVCNRVAVGYETTSGRHVDPRWAIAGLSQERMTCLLRDGRSPVEAVLSVLASCNAHAGSCLEDWMVHSASRWGAAFSPVKGVVEITTSEATKAAALARLCERSSVSSREVIAFGDSMNDFSMLQWAGVGVAVANADDRLRAEADLITSSNDEDGVAKALRCLLADQVTFRPGVSAGTLTRDSATHRYVRSPSRRVAPA